MPARGRVLGLATAVGGALRTNGTIGLAPRGGRPGGGWVRTVGGVCFDHSAHVWGCHLPHRSLVKESPARKVTAKEAHSSDRIAVVSAGTRSAGFLHQSRPRRSRGLHRGDNDDHPADHRSRIDRPDAVKMRERAYEHTVRAASMNLTSPQSRMVGSDAARSACSRPCAVARSSSPDAVRTRSAPSNERDDSQDMRNSGCSDSQSS